MIALIRAVGVAVVGSLLWAACGGDSNGGNDDVALCKEYCNKFQSLCFPDASTGTSSCESSCTARDNDAGSGTTCTNAAEINAAVKACMNKNSCQDLLSCAESVPDCQGGGAGGAGGSGGSGGTGGTAGSGGTGDGGSATCANLLACCNAASTDQLKMACTMAYDAVKGQGDAACGQVYTSFKPTFCP